jgi:hypothetical protein
MVPPPEQFIHPLGASHLVNVQLQTKIATFSAPEMSSNHPQSCPVSQPILFLLSLRRTNAIGTKMLVTECMKYNSFLIDPVLFSKHATLLKKLLTILASK